MNFMCQLDQAMGGTRYLFYLGVSVGMLLDDFNKNTHIHSYIHTYIE